MKLQELQIRFATFNQSILKDDKFLLNKYLFGTVAKIHQIFL